MLYSAVFVSAVQLVPVITTTTITVTITITLCAQPLQSCLTLGDPVNSSPPGSSIHGILEARIPELSSDNYNYRYSCSFNCNCIPSL